jgi:vacuolar-type H+-ATPase subunit H
MVDRSLTLSPLDQIRLAESDITRQITAAKVNADQRIVQARLQTEQSKKEAHEQGRREGQLLIQEVVVSALEEAKVIKEQGCQKSVVMNRKGQLRMKEAVQFAVDFVIGTLEQDSNA